MKMGETTVFVLWYQFCDKSGSGLIWSYDDKSCAERDKELLDEYGDALREFFITEIGAT